MNFDEKTYENLLQEKLDSVDNKYDKRETSLIYNALAPNSMEIRSMYIFLQWVLDNVFGDTAEREYLERIALFTKGIIPTKATRAVYRLETDVPVEIGSRFTAEIMTFEVTEEMESPDGYYNYKAQCIEYGISGNGYTGTAIPIEYIQNLTRCELTELLVPGENEEDTEVFRQRWKDSFNNIAFGGNKADYKAKVNSINGVGNCKVYRATDSTGALAGGYVKITIINSEFETPSTTLVDAVQQEIDPTRDGEGNGLAPIGHTVTIAGVEAVTIDVEMTVTCSGIVVFDDIKSQIESALQTYLKGLSEEWADVKQLTVYSRQAQAAIITAVKEVEDITTFMMNGVDGNIELTSDQIPVLGGVTNAT